MTKESIVEWASSWVSDEPPGQRQRFVEALTAELKDWREPTPEPAPRRFCKNCPFTEFLHGEGFLPPGCSGFEPLVPGA